MTDDPAQPLPLEELRKRYGTPDMALPDGKACRDCRHFTKCARLFQCEPTNIECDWSPSRFAPSPSEAKQEGTQE
jgi:hypothetical protein